MEYRSFKKGDIIIKEGECETCAYILEAGRVEVSGMANKKKAILAILEGKQIFGEMGLMEDKARSATVTALEDTLVSVIDRKTFNEQLAKNPKILLPIFKVLFERLRTINQKIIAKGGLGTTWEAKYKKSGKSGFAILSGLNETSTKALNGNTIKIEKFPFKVGRKQDIGGNDVLSDNDLYLEDSSKEPPFNISSNHFLIDMVGNKYAIVDRGSSLGTIVNGIKIKEPCVLDKKINAIVVGSLHSPFVFKLDLGIAQSA